MEINEITREIIGAAIAVHKALGPGLLESVYEACLVYERSKTGLHVEVQKAIQVVYGDVKIAAAYRVDLAVEGRVFVEIKSVQRLERIHVAQLLSYLRLSSTGVGLLINFNVEVLRSGIHRVVNNYRGPRLEADPSGEYLQTFNAEDTENAEGRGGSGYASPEF